MPIYEYRCDNRDCSQFDQRWDKLQKLDDVDPVPCPTCGVAGQRMLSAPSFAIGGAHHLKEKHFAEKGFTQYKRLEKGVYEKTAGKGPAIISDPGD